MLAQTSEAALARIKVSQFLGPLHFRTTGLSWSTRRKRRKQDRFNHEWTRINTNGNSEGFYHGLHRLRGWERKRSECHRRKRGRRVASGLLAHSKRENTID